MTTVKFPDEIKNNKSYRSYEVYAASGELMAKWEREADTRDIPSDLENNMLPVYNGEWAEWTNEQIEVFNKEHKLARHSMKDTAVGIIGDVKMSAREASRVYKENELAAAEALLASLKAQAEEV